MFQNAANHHHQGTIGLSTAIGWFTANGYTVSIPLADIQGYDLVVERDGVFQSVQVKTAGRTSDGRRSQVELRTHSHRYRTPERSFTYSRVDLLFVVTESAELYLIPRGDVRTSRSIDLGGAKYRQWQVPSFLAVKQ